MNAVSPIQFELVPRLELGAAQQAAMFELLSRHFSGVTPEQFGRDLMEKSLVLLLHQGGTLVGFSTLLAYPTSFEGATVNVIYSGDTIVAPAAWGSSALPRAWVAGVERLRASLPPGRCFWLLLTSGFRTYRFLPVFWKTFFPRHDAVTPPAMQRLLDQLARERFGGQFDAGSRVVRFNAPQRLRDDLQEIPAGRDQNPHVAFFLSRNLGHACGDELVCLTELGADNLTRAGQRMMKP